MEDHEIKSNEYSIKEANKIQRDIETLSGDSNADIN
jgi:hypothetical protein